MFSLAKGVIPSIFAAWRQIKVAFLHFSLWMKLILGGALLFSFSTFCATAYIVASLFSPGATVQALERDDDLPQRGIASNLAGTPQSRAIGNLKPEDTPTLRWASDADIPPTETATSRPSATPSPTPSPTATSSPTVQPTGTATQRPTLTPTSTHTATPNPTQTPLPAVCMANFYNCRDFSSQADAQAIFDRCYAAVGDVHVLDQNNNQLACEQLGPVERDLLDQPVEIPLEITVDLSNLTPPIASH